MDKINSENNNLKHNFLYESEALILSSLVATPIFLPVERKKTKVKELSEFEILRTSREKVMFSGYRLDLQRDYPLFHLIMRKKQTTGKKEFIITESEIMKSLKIQNRKSNKIDIDSRIKKMMSCHFEIEKYDENGMTEFKIYSNLINRVQWDLKSKTFLIEISDDLFNSEQKVDYEIMNLETFQSIKSQYARSLFLFYETFKFISSDSIKFPMEKLWKRLGNNNMEQKYLNQEIKKANNELVNMKYLKDVEYYKAMNKSNMCKIFR